MSSLLLDTHKVAASGPVISMSSGIGGVTRATPMPGLMPPPITCADAAEVDPIEPSPVAAQVCPRVFAGLRSTSVPLSGTSSTDGCSKSIAGNAALFQHAQCGLTQSLTAVGSADGNERRSHSALTSASAAVIPKAAVGPESVQTAPNSSPAGIAAKPVIM